MQETLSKKTLAQAAVVIGMVLSVGYIFASRPSFRATEENKESQDEAPRLVEDIFERGTVLSATEGKAGIDEGFLEGIISQEAVVRLDSGVEKGKEVTLAYEIAERPGYEKQLLGEGGRVVVGKNVSQGEVLYYISDIYRLPFLWLTLALFFGMTVLLSGRRGVASFIGLVYSLFVVGFFVVPHILSGGNPFVISILATALIAAVSLFFAHGVSARSAIAFVATLITIGISLIISILSVQGAHLFGLGSEEAFYLQYAPIPAIDLRGLFLGAIIIGVLGILDDVTTTQTAAVEEIYKANPSVSFGELYTRGASVGKEHIISLVNTLVLAYTGASFPLLLLFVVYERPLWVTLNSEIVLQEVMRTLIGSMTLLFAVPLTTLLAAAWYTNYGYPDVRMT